MIDKRAAPTKLLWVDLEMTGLEPDKDLILEVAAVVTDFKFQPLASYTAAIKQDHKSVTTRMKQNSWWENYPANRDEFLQSIRSGLASDQAEQDLAAIIAQQFKGEPAVLAGNSVHMDRAFIKQWWPVLYKKLHYRMLDVTAFKIVMQGKFGIEYEKKESHRALVDIQESIAELQYYLKWFKEHPDMVLD
jgi:oligoribonuclease